MSIERDGSKYVLTCDLCGDTDHKSIFAFNDAVKRKKEAGWKAQKNGEDWGDICPECQKLGKDMPKEL